MNNDLEPDPLPQAPYLAWPRNYPSTPSSMMSPLSKCQKSMARTFGHANWHQMKQYKDKTREQLAIDDPSRRQMFYDMALTFFQVSFSVAETMTAIEEFCAMAGLVEVRDLAKKIIEDQGKGHSFSYSMDQLLAQHQDEALIIRTMEPAGKLDRGMEKCKTLTQTEMDRADVYSPGTGFAPNLVSVPRQC